MILDALRTATAVPSTTAVLAPGDAHGGAAARVRATWLVPLLVAVVAAGVASWASVPYIVGVFHDDGVYALLARSLATGQGFHYLQLPGSPAATHYPPLYPLALAAVWRLAPAFPDNIPALLALNAVCLGAFALGLCLLLQRWFGWRAETAGIVALCATLGVPTLTLSGALLSEPLFLAALPPALLLAHSAVERHDQRSALAGGAAIGVLMLIRTHGVALLGAALLLLVSRHQVRRAALLGAAAVAVQLPWLLWCAAAAPRVADPLIGTYGAYSGFFKEGWRAGGISLLGATMRTNLHELWLLLGDRVWEGMGRSTGTASALMLVGLLALGARRAVRRAPLLPLFVAVYFAIVIVMSCTPYRYAWGAWPLLVVLAVLGAEGALGHVTRLPYRVAVAAVLAVPLLAVAHTEWRGYATRRWEQPTRNASRAIAPLVEWIRRTTPPGATVLVEAPEIVMLFTGHHAAPPVPFTALEYAVPLRADDFERGLRAMLAAVPADYLVTLSPGVSAAAHAMPSLVHLGALPGAETFQVRR